MFFKKAGLPRTLAFRAVSADYGDALRPRMGEPVAQAFGLDHVLGGGGGSVHALENTSMPSISVDTVRVTLPNGSAFFC
jgi:hypothetical protein